jgi:hypothetical protein
MDFLYSCSNEIGKSGGELNSRMSWNEVPIHPTLNSSPESATPEGKKKRLYTAENQQGRAVDNQGATVST